MSDVRPSAVIVLAAGEGTRMRSSTPKALHTMCGRTLLGHVLAAAAPLNASTTVVVVGASRDLVMHSLAQSDVRFAVQDEQLGTGHATRVALESATDIDGTVLVLPGDSPMFRTQTLQRLLDDHHAARAAATVLSFRAADPTGYGRIVRSRTGAVLQIVEHKDATEDQRAIRECSSSVFAFDVTLLRRALDKLSPDNAQAEEYLPDVIGFLVSDGHFVNAVIVDEVETLGVNDRAQLAVARRLFNERILGDLMTNGVSIVDPGTTWVDVQARIEPDVILHPNTQLHGRIQLARGTEVGPGCTVNAPDSI